MSIQPPSDIVLDVAQAADPVKSMAAAQKLTRTTGTDAAADTGFSNVLENVSVPLDNSTNVKTQLGLMNATPNGTLHAGTIDAKTKAYKGLEALIFQNLFETTLPHDKTLGDGMAGDVWRSMLAEQLGKQASKMIDLGLFPKSPAAQPSQLHKGSTDKDGSST